MSTSNLAEPLDVAFIKIKVHPDSKIHSILKRADDSYEIWVRAPARNNLANKEALAALSKATGRDLGRLRMIRGSRSPSKIIQVFE